MSISLIELCINANEYFTRDDPHRNNEYRGFQSASKQKSLESSLDVLQAKIDAHEKLTQEEITNIAGKIHIEQIFGNANHRTGIYMVYALNILNGQLPRCKPYLLFGAAEYNTELFKEDSQNKENRILDVVNSRAIANIPPEIVHKLLDYKLKEIAELPKTMDHIRKNLTPSPQNIDGGKIRTAGTTSQVNNYKSVLKQLFPKSPAREIDSRNANATPSNEEQVPQASPIKFSNTAPENIRKTKFTRPKPVGIDKENVENGGEEDTDNKYLSPRPGK